MKKRMKFLEHLHELQVRLRKIVGVIFLEFLFFFTFGFKHLHIGNLTIVYPYPTLENSFSAAMFRAIWNHLIPNYMNGVELQPYASLGAE